MLCRSMERPRSAVIPQAAPGREHGLLSGSGQLFYSGKLLNKSFVALLNHSHSCLLQHNLRDQDTVGIGFASPWQLALFAIEPAQQPLTKFPGLLRTENNVRRNGQAIEIVAYPSTTPLAPYPKGVLAGKKTSRVSGWLLLQK